MFKDRTENAYMCKQQYELQQQQQEDQPQRRQERLQQRQHEQPQSKLVAYFVFC